MENNLSSPGLRGILNFCSVIFILFGIVLIGGVIFLTTTQYLFGSAFNAASFLTDHITLIDGARKNLIIAQFFTALISFIIIPLFIIYFLWPELLKIFHLEFSNFFAIAGLSTLILFVSLPLVAELSEWNKAWINGLPEQFDFFKMKIARSEKEAEALTNILVYYHSMAGFWAGLIVIALLPAVGEELLFRGIIQNRLMKIFSGPHMAILFTAFLFSFIHFQFLGFVPRMFLGILFGYLYYWSGNILISITVHFVNNAFTYIAMNYVRNHHLAVDLESTNNMPVVFVVISSLIFLFLLFRFKSMTVHKLRDE